MASWHCSSEMTPSVCAHLTIAVSCPEMARGRGPTAVQHLVVGDLHRLELTEKYPTDVPRPRPQAGVTTYFWPLRTDIATQ